MTTSSTTSTRRDEARAALGPPSRPLADHDPCQVPADAAPDPGDRVWLLEQAVQVLDAAAGAGDADLAEACRGVLDSLRSGATAPAARAGADRSTRDPALPTRVPLAPPAWARGSILEDGGIVHETVSPLHPTVKAADVNGSGLMPTDVSLSVVDLLVDGRWVRTRPTVQVEGGSYTLDGARHLREALDRLLAAARNDQDAAPATS